MGSKRLKGICPDQTCILFDKKKEKEPEKSNREITKGIANELGVGFNTIWNWLLKSKRVDAPASTKRLILPKLPKGKYNLLYADPPWKYDFSRDGRREIEKEYPTMSTKKISNMKTEINKVVADDAILFLWVTSPKLQEGINVMVDWGFEYTTCAVWVKDKIGMGYYFRQQHELLLVGKRGNFSPPAESVRISSVISSPRKKHSAKPKKIYRILEKMYPTAKKLELFAREKQEGWRTWGNELS